MNFEGITFDEKYDSNEYETATFYFNAPVSLLNEFGIDYNSTDIGAIIEIEFPKNSICPKDCFGVAISPKNEEGYEYNYVDVTIDYNDIEKLLKLV